MPGLEIRGRQKMSNINCLHIDHFQLRLVIALLISRVDFEYIFGYFCGCIHTADWL